MSPSVQPKLWSDPALEDRIARGIETHRKSDGELALTDAAGAPLAGVAVTLEQTAHAFRFGAPTFLIDAYPDDSAAQARHDALFDTLFNAATIPLYWRDLEPAPGQLRHAADSPYRYRRPPAERSLAFCRARDLYTNGHTLVWDHPRFSIPDWLSPDPAERERLLRARVAGLAARYGAAIDRWDVLNEPCKRSKHAATVPMPEDFEFKAFLWAAAGMPARSRLMVNETTSAWTGHLGRYTAIIRDLLARGARIDAIGLQYHLFKPAETAAFLAGRIHSPTTLLDALDHYHAAFRLPLHISEVTLAQPGAGPEAAEQQAETARSLYRLWFSHPAVDSITWWNLVDYAGAPGEDGVASGLLTRDLRPKTALHALDHLINHEWRTTVRATTDAAGRVRFRGFHGHYRVAVAGRALPDLGFDLPAGGTTLRLAVPPPAGPIEVA